MKKSNPQHKIILVTNGYPCVPYNQEFVFIKNELKELNESFDKVEVIANVAGKDYQKNTAAIHFDKAPTLLVKLSVFLRFYFWLEMLYEFRASKKINVQKIKIAASYLSKAIVFKRFIKYVEGPIYTFWLTESTLGGILAGRAVFSRAHGFDVYNNLHPENYLPFRELMFRKLRKLSFISKAGYEFASNQNNKVYESFDLNYLGIDATRDAPVVIEERKELHVVSCSGMIPLKRVGLIMDALEQVEGEVHWTHFGFGPLFGELKEKISQVSKSDLIIAFPGKTKNEEILKYMDEVKPDFFINASITEGVPVSIIEALACSVPVIAPDVGGIKEAIIQLDKFLVSVDDFERGMQDGIKYYRRLSLEGKNKLRMASFEKYKSMFISSVNNTKFFQSIKQHLNSF